MIISMKHRVNPARFLMVSAALLIAAVFCSNRASAQVLGNAIGPKIGFYLDGGNLMIGAIAEFPLSANIDIEPGAEIVLGIRNTSRIIGDVNIRYSFMLQGLTVRPFVLGGGGFQFDSYTTSGSESNTNTTFVLNLGAGATFNTRSRLQPWGGLKFSFLGGGLAGGALLQGGVNFYL
jgi:hypothetical protein